MSTHLQRPSLALIFNYGREALGNRYKTLIFLSFLFIFCPQLLILLAWGKAAGGIEHRLIETSALSPLTQVLTLFGETASAMVAPSFFGSVLLAIGVFALARTSVDYFESRPFGVKQTLIRALRVLITKGFGALLLLLVVLPALTIMPLLRAVAMSMLVMLPVTLVASNSGGFKTTWDTLWLRYASQTKYGRWPIFINVLSVTGLFLTALFGISLMIENLSALDTLFEFPAGILEQDMTIGGLKFNCVWLMSEIFRLAWEAAALAIIMPFTAAIYHLSTAPDGHIPFETEA